MDQITKEMADSLQLSDGPGAGTAPDAIPAGPGDLVAAMAELPPALRPGMTVDETLAELKSHPFFMTDLDNADDDNVDLAALQALSYEGTPLENAAGFKEQGNEVFRAKKWADAKEFYTKGVLILEADERKRRNIRTLKEDEATITRISKKLEARKKLIESGQFAEAMKPEELKKFHEANDRQLKLKEVASKLYATPSSETSNDPTSEWPSTWDSEEIAKQCALLEQLYVNRAACHLELSNYRSCILDCASTIRLNPKNIKAVFRSTKALLALDKIPEAKDACDRGLQIDSSNATLQAVGKQIAKRADEVEAKRKAEENRTANEKLRQTLLRAALKAREIKVRRTEKPPEMEDARIRLVPDETDPKSTLAFPTVLLYPTNYESDFIKAFNETETLEQHFGYVFPLPWDIANVYKIGGVECYMETISGGLLRIGTKVPLLKALQLGGDKIEIVDDLLHIFVVPKSDAPGWIKEFKEEKAARRKGDTA